MMLPRIVIAIKSIQRLTRPDRVVLRSAISNSTFHTISPTHRPITLSSHLESRSFYHSSPSRGIKSPAMSLPNDIQTFLAGYPDFPDDPSRTSNLRFYKNERSMQPEGLRYDEFMERYSSDYNELEMNHGYIQWLFPIPEQGMNHRAHPLQRHELRAMIADAAIVDRLFGSYCMMMAFYGIRVEKTGQNRLSLTDDYQERLNNLSRRSHNLLRLTRILKLLALFPTLSHHAAPLILFFTALHCEGHLDLSPSKMHGGSLDRWWVNCLRDEAERSEVKEIVRRRGGRGEGIWGIKQWSEWFDARSVPERQS